MTLTFLYLTGAFVNDKTKITVRLDPPGITVRGHWYDDRILQFFKCRITKLGYCAEENKLKVRVEREGETQ